MRVVHNGDVPLVEVQVVLDLREFFTCKKNLTALENIEIK